MQVIETPLLIASELNQKTICIDGIKAVVTQYSGSDFDVLLEISWNKILVGLQKTFDMIEEFEILAVKGFVELTKSFITTIKKLVEHLLCRLD